MALSVQDHAQIEIFLNGNLVNVQRHIKDSPSTCTSEISNIV